MKKLITITFLTILFLVPSFAQKSNNSLLLPDNSSDKRIKSEYDKFKDFTSISIEFNLLPYLTFSFGDMFQGKTPTSIPRSITVSFMSLRASERYFISPSCVFLADDKRIPLSKAHYIREGDGEVLVFFSLTYEELKKIANAKNVEMQLGSREFTLDKSQLEGLQELSKRLVP